MKILLKLKSRQYWHPERYNSIREFTEYFHKCFIVFCSTQKHCETVRAGINIRILEIRNLKLREVK